MNFFLSFDVYCTHYSTYDICTVRICWCWFFTVSYHSTTVSYYDIIKIHHYNTNNIRIIQYVLRKYYDIYDMS